MKNMLKNFVKNMLLWRRQGLLIRSASSLFSPIFWELWIVLRDSSTISRHFILVGMPYLTGLHVVNAAKLIFVFLAMIIHDRCHTNELLESLSLNLLSLSDETDIQFPFWIIEFLPLLIWLAVDSLGLGLYTSEM